MPVVQEAGGLQGFFEKQNRFRFQGLKQTANCIRIVRQSHDFTRGTTFHPECSDDRVQHEDNLETLEPYRSHR